MFNGFFPLTLGGFRFGTHPGPVRESNPIGCDSFSATDIGKMLVFFLQIFLFELPKGRNKIGFAAMNDGVIFYG